MNKTANEHMPNVLITGVSSGIGRALALLMLSEGYRVWGISRRVPEDLITKDKFQHASIDLALGESAVLDIARWLIKENQLRSILYLFLNAGRFSQRIANLNHVSLESIQSVMNVNVWANKLILDTFLNAGVHIDTCVVSSSIAGVRARAGNSAYALSKATLNMLIKQYAIEHPEIFFAVLGLCNVHTSLSHQISTLPLEGNFPEIESLRTRGISPGYLVTPHERAHHINLLLKSGIQNHVTSGEFAEIRHLLNRVQLSEQCHQLSVNCFNYKGEKT